MPGTWLTPSTWMRLEFYPLVCDLYPLNTTVRVYDLSSSLDPAPNADGTVVSVQPIYYQQRVK